MKNINKKIIVMVLLVALIIPGAYFIWPPKPAQAGFSDCLAAFFSAVGLSIGDQNGSPGAIVSIPVAIRNMGFSESLQTGNAQQNLVHSCIEEQLALAIGKLILAAMTQSIINWINGQNGLSFQGNPSFLNNPGSFFENIGDSIVGQAIQGTTLAFLCSPFKLNIQLALALNYSNSNPQSCTLSKVIQNSENALNSNNFSSWSDWFSISENAQNNGYGSYLQAAAVVDAGINSQNNIENNKLNWGNGFLSLDTCHDGAVKYGGVYLGGTGPSAAQEESEAVEPTGDAAHGGCSIHTPGNVIVSALNNQVGEVANQLGAADDLDKIFNALEYKLVTSVLSGLDTSGQSYSNSLGALQLQTATNALYQQTASSSESQTLGTLPTAPTSANNGSATSESNGSLTINLNGSPTMIVGIGSTFTDPGATASDVTDGNISSQITTSGIVDTAVPGTYTLVYSIVNSAGTATSITRTVIVDNPPTITLSGPSTETIYGGGSDYRELGATASDGIDGNISSKITITGAPTGGSGYGTYNVVYSVTDSVGLTSQVTRTVTLEDPADRP